MAGHKHNWSFYNDGLESIPLAPDASHLFRCITYITSLRHAWSELEIPQHWIDYTQAPLSDDVWALPALENLVGRAILYVLANQLVVIPDKVIEERSPYGPSPNFYLSARRYCSWNKLAEHRSAAWDQLSQFLVYQNSKQAAEFAIAMALDGVPSTLVRKRPVVVDRKLGKHFQSHGTDYSVIYTPIGPTTRRSRARMHYLPICEAHPALALCSEGPAEWAGFEDSPGSLSAVLEAMASTATVSMDSMINAWRRRIGRPQTTWPSDIPDVANDKEQPLPDWAFLLGIVYDAEAIRFIAHIPHIPEGEMEYQYISLLFETLPFPANGSSHSSEESLRDRYRVALAFLCLQHHIFRLTSLWDDVPWPTEVIQEPLDVMRELMDSWCDTPTPSQPPSDFMPLPPGVEIEYFDDEDDDPTHISDPVTAPVKVQPRVDEWLETLEGCSFEELEPWTGVV